jgi:DNA-binding transcriptional regulator PaaX
MEATCCPGYDNEAIVAGAWDFEEINQRYRAYIQTATLSARELAHLRETPAALPGWLAQERVAWRYVLALDPLLPRELWPDGYEGERAWNAKLKSCRSVASLLEEAAG